VYKVEPYVMAADVYGVHPHTGRGGWTWYTGSAGWMYQLILESFLGLQRRDDELWFEPCVPTEWPSFKLSYRYQDTVYNIEVIPNNEKVKSTIVDGVEQPIEKIKLVDDKGVHSVIIKCPTLAKNFSTNQKGIEEFHNNGNVKKN